VYQTGNTSSTVVTSDYEAKQAGHEPRNTVVASGSEPNKTNSGKEKECTLGCKITMIDIADRSKKYILL